MRLLLDAALDPGNLQRLRALSPHRDDLVLENVRRYLAGEPLLNPIDLQRGY